MTVNLDLIRGRQQVIPMTNKSGGARAEGEVVIVDETTDDAFTTTAVEGKWEVVGVVAEAIANNAEGRVIASGYAPVLEVDAATARGDWLRTANADPGKATPTANPVVGSFAIALSATGGAGQVSAFIFPGGASFSIDIASVEVQEDDVKVLDATIVNFEGGGGLVVDEGGGKGTVDITGGAHNLGGAKHNADTLANLNTKVSDGTLDKNTDKRPPSQGQFSITVEDPSNSENICLGFTFVAITITEVQAVVVGTSPSVTIDPSHSTDRSAAGNDILNAPVAITNTTVGQNLTNFDDPTIPTDSWIWLLTTAKSGTVDELTVTIKYTVD